MSDFKVEIWKDGALQETFQTSGYQRKTEINVVDSSGNNVVGDLVKVIIPQGWLHIAEVEVWNKYTEVVTISD